MLSLVSLQPLLKHLLLSLLDLWVLTGLYRGSDLRLDVFSHRGRSLNAKLLRLHQLLLLLIQKLLLHPCTLQGTFELYLFRMLGPRQLVNHLIDLFIERGHLTPQLLVLLHQCLLLCSQPCLFLPLSYYLRVFFLFFFLIFLLKFGRLLIFFFLMVASSAVGVG